MKVLDRIKQLFAPSVRYLVMLLAVCAMTRAWAAAPTPVVVWDGEAGSNYDFSQLTKVAANGATYSIKNVNTSAANNSSANYRGSDNSYLQIVNSDNGYKAITITATGGTNPFGSTDGTTVIMRTVDLPTSLGSNRALITLMKSTAVVDGSKCHVGVCRYNGGTGQNGYYIKDGVVAGPGTYTSNVFSSSRQDVALTYKSDVGLTCYVDGSLKINTWNSGTSDFTTPDGVCLGGLDISGSGKFYAQNGMKIIAVAIFDYSLSAEEVAAYKFPFETMISAWSDRTIKAWRTPTSQGKFHQGTFAPISSSGAIGTAAQLGGNEYHKFVLNDTTSGNSYEAPGIVVVYDRPGYRQSSDTLFTDLAFGGLFVNALQSADSPYTVTGSGNRSVYLGYDNYTTYFTFNESYVINRTLDRAGATHIKGTVNMSIADGKYFDCNSQQANADWKHHVVLDANATLKISGAGKLKVSELQATNSGATIDCSALGTEPATKFIEGTLVVDDNTKFKFPSGVIFPYKIATDISDGTTEGNQTFYIGETEYTTGHLVYDTSAGTVTAFRPTDISYTMSSNKTWAEVCGEGDTSDVFCDLHVTANSELTVTGSTTIKRLLITVDSGVELKIVNGGSGALTVTEGMAVLGSGKVTPQVSITGLVDIDSDATVLNSSTAYVTTFKGSGTIVFDGLQPTTSNSGSVYTSLNDADNWTGTVWIKNFNTAGNITQLYPEYWSNKNSKIKWTAVKGWIKGGSVSPGEWILEDEGSNKALTKVEGSSNKYIDMGKLSGSGTITDSGNGITARFRVKGDASRFTGKIVMPGTGGSNFIFGSNDDGLVNGNGAWIVVCSDAVGATMASSWTAGQKLVVKGTLTIKSGVDISGTTITGNGTVIGDKCIPLPSSEFTGTLRIDAAVLPSFTESSATAIYGSSLEIASGMAYLSGNITTLQPTISVSSTGTLVIGNASMTSLSIKVGTINGYLYFNESCTSLASLTINAGTNRAFPSSHYMLTSSATLTSVNIVVDEVMGDGGAIVLSDVSAFGAVAGRSYNYFVKRLDGETVQATYSNGTLTYVPLVSGVACWHDWEFEGNVNDAVTSDPKNLATNWGETTDIYSYENGESGNQVMKLTQRGGIDGSLAYPDTWSAAIRCKVPTNNKGIVVAFGNQGSGAIGLAAGETAGKVMLVDSINASTFRNIADMSIASPTTAFHVYVFIKTPSDVTTYCDGVLVNHEMMEKTLPSCFQIGTMIAGYGALAVATDGQIDYLRLYDYALSDAQITKLTSDNPYVSTTPVFTRDMAGSQWWYMGDQTWTKSDSTTAQYPAAGSIVEVTATDDASVTMNLPETTVFEKLTFKGTGDVTLVKNNDRPLSAAELEVKTNVTIPYALSGFNGTRVSVDEGKVLTFDFSNYDYSSVTTTTVIPVTGVVAARGNDSTYDTRFGIVSGSLPAHIASVTIGYNATTYSYEVTIAPDHEAGTTVYYGTGYITAVMDGSSNVGTVYVDAQKQNQTHLFPGDTMVFGESPASAVYISDIFNGNLEIPSNVTVDLRKGNVSNAVMDGRTITVNGTLTISQYAAQVHNFGSVTVNGTGTVRFDADATVSQLTGTATITVSSTKSLSVASGGSIANPISGSGSVSFATVPSSALSFSSWTGTVVLPSFVGSGQNLNNYGVAGSKVQLTGISSGWLSMGSVTINPEVVLAGDVTLTDSSTRTWTFNKISGTGGLSLTPGASGNKITITISDLASTVGTISNYMGSDTTWTINKISYPAETVLTAGTKLLSTAGTGTIVLSAVHVGGSAVSNISYSRDTSGASGDGFYVHSIATTEGSGSAAVTTVDADSTVTSVTVALGDSYAGKVVIPQTVTQLTMTGTSVADANLGLKVTYTPVGGSQRTDTYYNILTRDGSGNVSLKSDGSVTISEVVYYVMPALAASAPITFSSAAAQPTFAVKAIPGLWYRVLTGTALSNGVLSGTTASGNAVQATSTSVAPQAPSFPLSGNVYYYKIGVSATEP